MSIWIYQFGQYQPYYPNMNTHRAGDDFFAIVVVFALALALVIGLVLGYFLRDCSEAVKNYRSKVEQVFNRKKSELDNKINISGISPQISYALEVIDAIRNEIKAL